MITLEVSKGWRICMEDPGDTFEMKDFVHDSQRVVVISKSATPT